jgi:C1A family cysteine protease
MNNKRRIWGIALIVLIISGFLKAPFLEADQEELRRLRQRIEHRKMQWQAAETSISRLQPYERRKRLGGFVPFLKDPQLVADFPVIQAAPDQLDWRDYLGKDWVTSVKDQGDCGSCWAFGVVAAIEARYNIEKSSLPADVHLNRNFRERGPAAFNYHLDLSEQYLVSCSNAGDCTGGWEDEAAEHIKRHGIPQESCFPYEARNRSCQLCVNWENTATVIDDWGYVTTDTAFRDKIISALVNGPVATYLTIYSDFYYYNSGIYEHTSGSFEGGHIVAIIGYNKNQNYWICKNSWGAGWGEQGFFKIRMGDSSDVGTWTLYVRGIEQLNPVKAPLNFSGERLANYSLTQREWVDELNWESNPENSPYQILNYYIYRLRSSIQEKIAEVGPTVYTYQVRNVDAQRDVTYVICGYTSEYQEGRRAFITIEAEEE